ncbi:DUF4271 domain-containing protein [Bacteroidia bacterium]|nr:DUF4271 domain-containing protein [Bacteroidia bacterium]
MILQISEQLISREQSPLFIRIVLLLTLVCLVFLYALNRNWVTSMVQLAILPFQRFAWQSEKFMTNNVFRLSSILSLSIFVSIAICSYKLGNSKLENYDSILTLLWIFPVVILFSVIKFAANYSYFSIHKEDKTANLLVDFQYSLNQWFALLLGILLLVDVFYFRLHSNIYIAMLIVAGLYFLARLFGTILILQNHFNYSILPVFVYLCTFEIVPALFTAKVLFVNS